MYPPLARGYDDIQTAIRDIKNHYYNFPILVKPVDSSGSKGVSLNNNDEEAKRKIENAMLNSRNKRIILETYVNKYGYQIVGDGLSINGELVFRYFANDHFDTKCVKPFVPVSASFPYNMPTDIQEKIHTEIQRLLSLLNMGTSAYNFDIRIDKDFNVYLMEVAPRNSGNYIPNVIKYVTNVDLVECSIKAAMKKIVLNDVVQNGFYSYYAVHSYNDGILDHIEIDRFVEKNYIVENHIIKKTGDKVKAFIGANTTLGILLMKFDSLKQMLHMMDHSEEWIRIVLQ